MSEADFSSANILSRLFSSISVDNLKQSSDIMTAWQQTLLSIKGFQNDGTKPADYGSQLVDHSHIIDLKDGILIVETDHPGRIQMFQLYKNYILNGLKQKVSGVPIRNIVFKLQKIEKTSGGLRMPTEKEMDDAVEKTSVPFSGSVSEKASELPSELKEMFDSMKESLSH